jgi:hypothetical protein
MSTQTQPPGPPADPEPSRTDGRRPSGVDAPPAEAIREALAKLAELKEFVAYYIAVRIDLLKASIRNAGIYAALGVLTLIGGAAVIVTAIVLLLLGVAGAFAELMPGHPWLGDIVTAIIFLSVIAAVVLAGMKMLTKRFRNWTIQKYERRLSSQRQQFGSDVRREAERVRP